MSSNSLPDMGGVAVAPGSSSGEAVVHPDATLGVYVTLADGVVVMGQSRIADKVRIGAYTHVGYGSSIGHDAAVGAFSRIMPSSCVGAETVIGDGVLISANSTVMQGVTVGDGATVGAGSVVMKDVEPGATVTGVPAVEI